MPVITWYWCIQRYSILQRDYSSGLSDSLRAANRQKLIKAVEVAIWKYTDEAKHVQAALAQVPDDRMAHVVNSAARNILSSSVDTAVISRACLRPGASLNILLQAHWPDSPVWCTESQWPRSCLCQHMHVDARAFDPGRCSAYRTRERVTSLSFLVQGPACMALACSARHHRCSTHNQRHSGTCLQVFISYSPIWQQMQCVRKSEVCRALRCQVRDAGEQEDDDCSSIWQLGPPERPQSGLVYEHLEQAFYEALLQGNLSLDVLDALKQALNDTQFRRAANKIFSCLYSRCPSDDSMLALLGSCKDRLPELLEIAMVTTAETESGRRIHSLVQASPRRRAQRTQ